MYATQRVYALLQQTPLKFTARYRLFSSISLVLLRLTQNVNYRDGYRECRRLCDLQFALSLRQPTCDAMKAVLPSLCFSIWHIHGRASRRRVPMKGSDDLIGIVID